MVRDDRIVRRDAPDEFPLTPRRRTTSRRPARAGRSRRAIARPRLAASRPSRVDGRVTDADGDLLAHVRVLFDGAPLDGRGGRFTAWFQHTRTYIFTVVDSRTDRILLTRLAVLEAGTSCEVELRLGHRPRSERG